MELCVLVTQLCLSLCDPMDSSVHRILKARILEWVAISFSVYMEILLQRCLSYQIMMIRGFPGSQMVKIRLPEQGGAGLIPAPGAQIPYVSWPKKTELKTEAVL